MSRLQHPISLADWRRLVAKLYAAVRASDDPELAWRGWRDERDRLFREHPQSPLEPEHRARFSGLAYFDYDPAARFVVDLDTVEENATQSRHLGDDGGIALRPFARTRGLAPALGAELTLSWITGYGGGIFLAFADATSGRETYGGGRYLLDTIKGADLGMQAGGMKGGGMQGGRIVLDFNFAYYPSCAYSRRWSCPLAPPENRLPAAVRAGERAGERAGKD